MFENAKWIIPQRDMKAVAPLFFTEFSAEKPVAKATLTVTGLGIYTAKINGENVTDTVLNPGCVQYPLRHQYQEFDVTGLLKDNNRIEILLATGWLRGWLSSVASFRQVQKTRIAFSSSSMGGRLGAIRIMESWGSTP